MKSSSATDSFSGDPLLDIPRYTIDEQTLKSLEGIHRKVADILIQDGYWTVTA